MTVHSWSTENCSLHGRKQAGRRSMRPQGTLTVVLLSSDRVTAMRWQQLQADGHFKHSSFLQNGQQQKQLCLKGSQAVHQKSMSSSLSHLSHGLTQFLTLYLSSKQKGHCANEWMIKNQPRLLYALDTITKVTVPSETLATHFLCMKWHQKGKTKQRMLTQHSIHNSDNLGRKPFALCSVWWQPTSELMCTDFSTRRDQAAQEWKEGEGESAVPARKPQAASAMWRQGMLSGEPGHWGFKIIHTE